MPSSLRDFFQDNNPSAIKQRCINILQDSPLDFSTLIDLAHRLTLLDAELKSSNYKQRNFMAENMFGNVIGLLYDNYPEMMHNDSEDRPYLRLDADIRVYPKKLNEKYLPGNVITDHVRRLNGQELFEDGTQIHVLYCGYILTDRIWPNQLKGSYISYVNTYYPSKVEWVLDLQEFRKEKAIDIPIHVQQIEELLVVAKRNLPSTGESGL